MSKIMIIGATNRPSRMSAPVTAWIKRNIETFSPDTAIDIVDLGELNLPFLDEPQPPMQGNYVHEHTKVWSERVASADGFIIATPEYNAGYPAPLKNAIDFLYAEWNEKPVAFVGYGSSPAVNSIRQLKEVTTRIKMKNINVDVSIPEIWNAVDEDGVIKPEAVHGSIGELISELQSDL